MSTSALPSESVVKLARMPMESGPTTINSSSGYEVIASVNAPVALVVERASSVPLGKRISRVVSASGVSIVRSQNEFQSLSIHAMTCSLANALINCVTVRCAAVRGLTVVVIVRVAVLDDVVGSGGMGHQTNPLPSARVTNLPTTSPSGVTTSSALLGYGPTMVENLP